MIKLITPYRGSDNFGAGHFHAPRGSRIHQGVDFNAAAQSKVCAILAGEVTKLGYTYTGDMNYRYVQVTDDQGYRLRYYYVKPLVTIGMIIKADDIIGLVQNLDAKYKGIPNHVHFEIKEPTGNTRINPENYIKERNEFISMVRPEVENNR